MHIDAILLYREDFDGSGWYAVSINTSHQAGPFAKKEDALVAFKEHLESELFIHEDLLLSSYAVPPRCTDIWSRGKPYWVFGLSSGAAHLGVTVKEAA